jgi:hypothetical protein
MGRDWEEKITHPDEIAVFRALANPDWNFRTVHGIAKETDLSPARVKEVIQAYPDLIGRSEMPDVKGRDLYYLKSRQSTFQRFLAKLRRYV